MGRSYIRSVGTGSIYNESEEIMAGQIVFCAGNSIPNGYLECNGATVSRTTYATLFAAIGSIYGAGDGATTFQLPDLRGEFIRGADRGRGVDSGRAVGSAQAQDVQAHNHSITMLESASGSYYDYYPATRRQGDTPRVYQQANTANSTGTETRPRNIAMIAAIKYS